ncbi:MAG: fibronectin type III domain-containing protein [Acidobacteriaceae bacterium]|nr:fibronectin type III domain-containing protein [Acidobacteriaceae bacterium]
MLFSAGAAVAQNPTAPKDLEVTAATKSSVSLSWKAVAGAAGYQVERRSGSGAFAAAGEHVPETSATDSKIDPYTIYTYRVKALGQGAAASAASNEVQVGPPPMGFNQVSPTPEDNGNNYGYAATSTLDANDDPIFAFYHRDPNHNGHTNESVVLFVGWDRAKYHWRAPVKVDDAGDFPDRLIPISLARDAATGQLALAWLRQEDKQAVAFSNDNGVTWAMQPIDRLEDENQATSCSVALSGGEIHLAFFNSKSPVYMTGKTSDPASKWKRSYVPAQEGTQQRGIGHLALDSSGKPGIAYIVNLDAGGVAAMYWRPGSNPAKALDSNGIQNDGADARLAFEGEKPRVLFAGSRDKVDLHLLWFSASQDGASWSEPVAIPSDGNRLMGGPMSIAVSPKASYAVVATDNAGNWDGVKCGYPKLSLSNDGRQWSTCSPNPRDKDTRDSYTTAAYAGDGSLYLTYRAEGPSMKALVVWRGGASGAANVAIHK